MTTMPIAFDALALLLMVVALAMLHVAHAPAAENDPARPTPIPPDGTGQTPGGGPAR